MHFLLLFLSVNAHDYKCAVVHGVCRNSLLYLKQGFHMQPFTCWHPAVNGTDLCQLPKVVQTGVYNNGSTWNKITCGGCAIEHGCIWHPFTCKK